MEICPKCGERTLCYDPRLKRARCLSMVCHYSRNMSQDDYSYIFEVDKDVANKLTLRGPR